VTTAMITVFAQMPSGMIQGRQEYVAAAYIFTWVFFVGYAASLYLRSREEA